MSGLLPRDQETSSRHDKIKLVNQKLREWCQSGRVRNVYYLKPDKDWTEPDGQLVERYYFTDFLHLVEEGYEKFAKSIYEAIVNVSQGNVVDLVKDRKRSRSKSGLTMPPPKTQQKQSGQPTSMTFTTTVLPRPKPTVTLPPPTAIAPKLNGTTTHCTTYTITGPYTNTETTATDMVTASPTTHKVTATQIDNTFTSTLTDTATSTTSLKDTTTHLTTPTDNTSATITTNTPTPLTDMTAPADTTNNLIPQTDITAKDATDSVITTDITTNPTDITASTITNTEMDTMTADTNTTNHPHNITNFRYFRTFLILCMFLTITKHCVFTSVNESSLNSKNNYCNVYGNKTYRFLMREIGIFTGVGNGFQEAGMAYTSTNGPSLCKTDFHSTHLKKAKHTHNTGGPILNISIAKIVLLPLLSVILVTIGYWFAKISSLKYVNFKHRYLFFGKLRKCPSKHKIIYALHKIFLLLLIALLFNVKVPAKTYHNIELKTGVHHKIFMGECFASIETTRTSCLKEQYSLYVLSKLKYSKHCWYLQYILLLSGDINLHPGPVQYPCLVCSKAVRKRVFCCNKCGLWVHKKCCIPSKNISNGSSFICKPCKNNANISYDNIWHQFPIADDYFLDDKTVPYEKQIDPDFDKSSYTDSYTDNWKVFNKRGLHFIHLNINSVLSKINELRIIANKSKASVIGITKSKLDETVLDGEINIDGYELVR